MYHVANAGHVAVVGFVAGVAAHLGIFIRGEWHLKTFQILTAHCLLYYALLYFLYSYFGSFRDSFLVSLLGLSCYLSSLSGSIILYRLCFHATARFPGPRLAGVTQLWYIYKTLDSKNYTFLQSLYQQYGTFVRTGPNEITICHPDAIQELDYARNETTKDVWYDSIQPRLSLIFNRDERDHKQWRKAWTRSLTKKCLDAYRPRLIKLCQSLSKSIGDYGDDRIEMNAFMGRFAFDFMGEVLLGEDFGLIRSGSMHPVMESRDRALSLFGHLGGAVWIANLAFKMLPFHSAVKDWFHLIDFCDEQIIKRKQVQKDSKLDQMSFFLEEHARATDTRRDLLLSGTAISAVVAGSDTTRASLVISCWYLARYPNHADKIRSETESVDLTNSSDLLSKPHLSGFIKEVLRLVPPNMTGLTRITGPKGLTIDGTFVPPFTRVVAPKYGIMRLESAFAHPNDFIPERWSTKPELVHNQRAFGPFGFGNRECVGKGLSLETLSIVLATLVRDFKISFAPGYDPDTMWRDMEDKVTAQPGELLCVFERM